MLLDLVVDLTRDEPVETFDEKFARIAAFPQPDVLPLLRALLTHPISYIRSSAGQSLLLLNASATLPWVLSLLYDPDTAVRTIIAYELCLAGDARAVNDLCSVVQTDPDGTIRAYAACALGNIGDACAIATLEAVAKSDRGVDYSEPT